MLPELTAKGLELLREAVPRISRVAILYNSANPAYGPLMKGIEVPARRLGVEVQLVGVQTPNELDGAFAAMKKERADGLLVHRDPVFHADFRKRILELAAEHRLPAIYRYVEAIQAGGLMGYGPNTSDMWRRAATYVDKILKGAKPADLPVEQPTRFELVINMKTAKALGLTMPQSLLLRADHVIQ
jgi:putative ABC transport system substrate-binding protein